MIRLFVCIIFLFSSLCFALEDKERSCQSVKVDSLGWNLNTNHRDIEYANLCESIEREEVLSALGYGWVQQEAYFSYRKLYLLLKNGEVEKVGMLVYPISIGEDILPKAAPGVVINSIAPDSLILSVYKNSISKLYSCRNSSCGDGYLNDFSLWGKIFNKSYRDFRSVIEARRIGLAGFPPYTYSFDYDHQNNQISYFAAVPDSGLWHVVLEVDSNGHVVALSRVVRSVR